MKQDGRKNNGGARDGAGRKALDVRGEVGRVTVSLDDMTRRTMEKIGEGNLSRGIRRSAAEYRRRFGHAQAKGKAAPEVTPS